MQFYQLGQQIKIQIFSEVVFATECGCVLPQLLPVKSHIHYHCIDIICDLLYMTKGTTGDPFPIIWPKCEKAHYSSIFSFLFQLKIQIFGYICTYSGHTKLYQTYKFHEKFPMVLFIGGSRIIRRRGHAREIFATTPPNR